MEPYSLVATLKYSNTKWNIDLVAFPFPFETTWKDSKELLDFKGETLKIFLIIMPFFCQAITRLKDTQIVQIRSNDEKWLSFHKAKFQFLWENGKLQR